jgi:Tfp pilus assembly protein PilP
VSAARRTLGLAALGLALAACGVAPAAPPPPSPPVAAVPVVTTSTVPGPTMTAATTPVAATAPAPLVPAPSVPAPSAPKYEEKGRRDPFVSLEKAVAGPKGLDVATTKLTGIVQSARTTLALVETQDGIGYILKPGDTLGEGRVVEIGADTVVFSVEGRAGSPPNRVVLRLAGN